MPVRRYFPKCQMVIVLNRNPRWLKVRRQKEPHLPSIDIRVVVVYDVGAQSIFVEEEIEIGNDGDPMMAEITMMKPME